VAVGNDAEGSSRQHSQPSLTLLQQLLQLPLHNAQGPVASVGPYEQGAVVTGWDKMAVEATRQGSLEMEDVRSRERCKQVVCEQVVAAFSRRKILRPARLHQQSRGMYPWNPRYYGDRCGGGGSAGGSHAPRQHPPPCSLSHEKPLAERRPGARQTLAGGIGVDRDIGGWVAERRQAGWHLPVQRDTPIARNLLRYLHST
jgi:hypothetical protein